MSGDSYSGYSDKIRSSLGAEKGVRSKKLVGARETLRSVAPETVDHTKFNKDTETVDLSKARMVIQAPRAQKNLLVLVDNSASNFVIADHIKQCSGFLLAPFGAMGLSVSFGWMEFSDHLDRKPIQEIDFIIPSAQGEDELTASMRMIDDQSGHDIPEMIECAMLRAARDLPIDGTDTALVLVTDSIAHGMGFHADSGCPKGVKWEDALAEVHKKFSDFILIGCANPAKYPTIPKLQAKFFDDNVKRALNFIDISSIENDGERKRLVVNAIQFVGARRFGIETVEKYFSVLYEKLLEEGLKGQKTDDDARDRVVRFSKYLEISEKERSEMLARVFGEA